MSSSASASGSATGPLSQSTPHEHLFSESQTPRTPPTSRGQLELRKSMRKEIGNQTWEFPPDTVARMLSPKKLKSDLSKWSETPTLCEADCLIDHDIVTTALKETMPVLQSDETGWSTTDERPNYTPLTAMLNKVVATCDVVYDQVQRRLAKCEGSGWRIKPREERWWSQFRFHQYDREAGDGIDGAHPLKPTIAGLDLEQPPDGFVCYWCLRRANGAPEAVGMKLPLEEKNEWQELVEQAGTYARAMSSASSIRTFALVIGYNHRTQELRFLIYHRGGLTATTALKLTEPDACRHLQKLMLSVLLWQSPSDAGLSTFTDRHRFCLPEPFSECWSLDNRVLWQNHSARGRNTWVVSLQAASETHPPPNATLPRVPQLGKPSAVTSLTGAQVGGLAGAAPRPSKRLKVRVQGSANQSAVPDPTNPHNPVGPKLSMLQPSCMIPPLNELDHTITPDRRSLVVKCASTRDGTGRGEADMLRACNGMFGCPDHLASFQPCFENGMPMANSIFLPLAAELKDRFWDVFRDPVEPEEPDKRSLWISLLGEVGQHLDQCADAQDLCECLLHAMLGWLSAYQRGYLHRDISIGNILKLPDGSTRRKFSATGVVELLRAMSPQEAPQGSDPEDSDFGPALRLAANNPRRSELVTLAKGLDDTLKKFGLATECKATWTDGDMCAYIPTYFDAEHNSHNLSGTYEFLSQGLLMALANGPSTSYLQSPVDDMWSFFYTALWATLHNSQNKGTTSQEKTWRDKVREGGDARDATVMQIVDFVGADQVDFSPMLLKLADLLGPWQASLRKLNRDWRKGHASTANFDKADRKETLLLLMHEMAYRGVQAFAEALLTSEIVQEGRSRLLTALYENNEIRVLVASRRMSVTLTGRLTRHVPALSSRDGNHRLPSARRSRPLRTMAHNGSPAATATATASARFQDALSALETYKKKDPSKVVVRFKAVGNAPIMKQNFYKITASNRFQAVIQFLRKELAWTKGEPLFTYINLAFSPAPDDTVANLFKTFSTDGHLIVNYSTTAAWG